MSHNTSVKYTKLQNNLIALYATCLNLNTSWMEALYVFIGNKRQTAFRSTKGHTLHLFNHFWTQFLSGNLKIMQQNQARVLNHAEAMECNNVLYMQLGQANQTELPVRGHRSRLKSLKGSSGRDMKSDLQLRNYSINQG